MFGAASGKKLKAVIAAPNNGNLNLINSLANNAPQ